MSGDENLIEAYRQKKDIYATIAAKAFHKPYEECMEFYLDENGKKTDKVSPEGKKRRNSIKSVVLGILYGRGEASIAEQLGISKKEAKGIIDEIFTAFPKIKEFTEKMMAMAVNEGYVETAYGRKRRLPDIQLPPYEVYYKDLDEGDIPANVRNNYITKMKKAWGKQKSEIVKQAREDGIVIKDNGGKIAEAERQVVNSIIQGSAADITKLAMIDLWENQELRDLGYRMLITVHDEIIGECPEENALKCKTIVEDVMINSCADHILVPMTVDCDIVRRWYGEDITKELEEKYTA